MMAGNEMKIENGDRMKGTRTEASCAIAEMWLS
jgi:hypothetical protein